MNRCVAVLTILCSLALAPVTKAADDPALIARGKYLAIAADCAACHSGPDAKPFAGGVALKTPFGAIVSANITPDPVAGIGGWTETEFISALWEGRGRGGRRLFPAMPYTAYTQMAREDVVAIFAYLKTVDAVPAKVETNQLPFPFNIRSGMAVWNLLNFRAERFQPNPARSERWNRGRYLVDVLEHCGVCHTPKNFLGADKSSSYLKGGTLQGWYAPNIAPDKEKGIGSWKDQELFDLFRSGQTGNVIASGPMAEVVSKSTMYLTDDDLNAIIAYLKDKL